MPLPTKPARTTSTVCSKPKGEYCRLHNPAPAGFNNLNDVFAKAGAEVGRTGVLPERPDNAKFQFPGETRSLADNIPEDIDEHMSQSSEALSHLSDSERKAVAGYTSFAAGVCNSVLLGNEYTYYEHAPLWKEAPGGPCDFLTREDLVDYMETMDEILSVRTPERRIIYRGIPIYSSLHDEIGDSVGKKLAYSDKDGLAEGLAEFYKEGKVFKFDTYLSTTHSAMYAADRSEEEHGTKKEYYHTPVNRKGIVFELKTNAGVDVTGAARHNSYEREVALPRETYFKVVNVDVFPEKYDTVSGKDFKRGARKDLTQQNTFYEVAAVVQLVEVDKEGRILHTQEPHRPETPIDKYLP